MITIIDYGMGNLGSIANMLKKLKVSCQITSDLERIRSAEKIILPGVGAFDTAVQQIDNLSLREVLIDFAVKDKKPLLGICLGMQLLMDGSEEGSLKGLGIIKGKALHFKNHIDKKFKIPHMGWNIVNIKNECSLTSDFSDEIRFYFVHSYFVKVSNTDVSMMTCNYGIKFDAAVQSGNIYGAQFHPEKSHKFGMQFLNNFANL